MTNENLLPGSAGRLNPAADAIHRAGATACALEPKQRLAQYAATGSFGRTFYATATEQLDELLQLAGELDPKFVAQCAVWVRRRGFMKQLPAVLCAVLSIRDTALMEKVFPVVIDDGEALRELVRIARLSVIGPTSLGDAAMRMVREWLEARSPEALFRESGGESPSMADVITLVNPKPPDARSHALYEYLLGRAVDEAQLPELVRQFDRFKRKETWIVPDVPTEMLLSLEVGPIACQEVALNVSWKELFMNLASFSRREVFHDARLTSELAGRLRDAAAAREAHVYPYLVMTNRFTMEWPIPRELSAALDDVFEVAIDNVPALEGQVFVCPDVSFSMCASAYGEPGGAKYAVRCLDVAALIATTILRKNPSTEVIPFDEQVWDLPSGFDPRDSVATNAGKLQWFLGSGTNCSVPLAELNRRTARGKLVILVSDRLSWSAATNERITAMMAQWDDFRLRNPDARLVCIDVRPSDTSQAVERDDILNVGGFSDAVFDRIAEHAAGGSAPDRWLREIEAITL